MFSFIGCGSKKKAERNAIMITIHRPAPSGHRENGYTVGMADTRNATFFLSEALNQDSDLSTNSTIPRS